MSQPSYGDLAIFDYPVDKTFIITPKGLLQINRPQTSECKEGYNGIIDIFNKWVIDDGMSEEEFNYGLDEGFLMRDFAEQCLNARLIEWDSQEIISSIEQDNQSTNQLLVNAYQSQGINDSDLSKAKGTLANSMERTPENIEGQDKV